MSKYFSCPYCKSENTINRYLRDPIKPRDVITMFQCLDCENMFWIDRAILIAKRKEEELHTCQ